MNKKEERQVVLGAARSQMRSMGFDPIEASFDDLLKILDDLSQQEPSLVASYWYRQATDNQIVLLKREWRKYRKTYKDFS